MLMKRTFSRVDYINTSEAPSANTQQREQAKKRSVKQKQVNYNLLKCLQLL